MARKELDLTAVEWPVCLFRFNSFLEAADSGCRLRVWVGDRDVLRSIRLLVENTDNRIVEIREQAGRIQVGIQKTGSRTEMRS